MFYSSPYCYFRSPSGTIYSIDDDRGRTLGFCEFKKQIIDKKDNGTWICGFSKQHGQADDSFPISVRMVRFVKKFKIRNYVLL